MPRDPYSDTAPRSPSALRLARELAELRRTARWLIAAVGIAVLLEALTLGILVSK